MQRLRSLATAKRSPAYVICFTVVAFLVSFLLRYKLEEVLPPGFPYLTFFPAVILTGFFAGTRAGVAVAILCGMASWYFFLAPQNSWVLYGPSILALAFYVVIVTTDLVLIHAMRLALTKLDAERQHSDLLALQNKTMFHELQHRVSNNLQVIASLLKMQQRNLPEGPARMALETASARLRIISSIQRQLHNPKRQQTDIGQVLRAVLPEVIESSDASTRVALEFNLEPLVLNGDQATPVALIAVELTSNALEHAVSEEGITTITVSTLIDGETACLRIADDGKGLPPDFQPDKARSLGLRVAFQFADQLGGTMDFASRNGTVATLSFPLRSQTTEV